MYLYAHSTKYLLKNFHSKQVNFVSESVTLLAAVVVEINNSNHGYRKYVIDVIFLYIEWFIDCCLGGVFHRCRLTDL